MPLNLVHEVLHVIKRQQMYRVLLGCILSMMYVVTIRTTKALFRYSRIYINSHVLGQIGVELELNSTLIYPNTCGLI